MNGALRRTKIVATLGPASNSLEMLKKMIRSGLNCARLNFSHGIPSSHEQTAKLVRQAAAEEGQIVGIMADLQGPKIRISKFKKGKVILKEGAEFVLDSALATNDGDEKKVSIDYKELPDDINANDILLLDDGRIVLTVKRVEDTKIICQVTVGGTLSDNKGINRQGGGLSAPALTSKDKKDLLVAVGIKVDYIAISFPRSADDVREAKKLIASAGGEHIGVVAKIERFEAVEAEVLDAIIEASDGVMVARGDLGVEIGDAQVPAAQKRIIRRSHDLCKPVITATQMMETMIENVVPTRAEVSDVANAVLDGTDAVMLSAESAVGKHPDLVVKTMARVCQAAERDPITQASRYLLEAKFTRIDEAISTAAMYTANHLPVKAIITLTESGSTPLWMSRIRTGIPIFGLARHKNTLGRMTLYRDVHSIYFDVTKIESTQVKKAAVEALKKQGYIKDGDRVIITRGPRKGIHGGTNSLTIIEVGGKNK